MSATLHPHQPGDVGQHLPVCGHCQGELPAITAFCNHCGQPLEGYVVYPEEDVEQTCPFEILIKDKLYNIGAGGLVELVLNANGARGTVSRVEIGLESSCFDGTESLNIWRPGDDGRLGFEFVPKIGGEFQARLRLIHWDREGSPNVYVASDCLIVNAASAANNSNVNIDFGNMSGNYGFDMSGGVNVTIDNSKSAAEPELPGHFRKNSFRPLPLRWSLSDTKLVQESIRQPDITLPKSSSRQRITKAWLRAYLPGGECKIACLKVGSVLSLGRDYTCDMVCHMLTPDNKPDPRCNSVSSNHCDIMVEATSCVVHDRSTNGTYVGQEFVHHGRRPVRNGEVISLAGVMPIRLREFRDISSLHDELRSKAFRTNLDKLSFAASSFAADGITRLPLNCVRLKRLGEGRNLFENFVLLHELDIGQASSNALVLPHESVAKSHAKIRVDNGGMLLIAYADVDVNGRRLSRHEPHPLASGDRLRFGDVELEFDADSGGNA